MEIVLTYKTAKLIKWFAEELDMFLEFEKANSSFCSKVTLCNIIDIVEKVNMHPVKL